MALETQMLDPLAAIAGGSQVFATLAIGISVEQVGRLTLLGRMPGQESLTVLVPEVPSFLVTSITWWLAR